MISIILEPHAEKLAPPDSIPGYLDTNPLLYHQVRTFEAFQRCPLVMNTYPTGTGKTTAALLRLLHPEQRGRNALLIAPTNALIDQHAADVETFIARNNLGMRVITVNAARIHQLAPDVRRGEVLQRLLHNPLTVSAALGIPDDAEKQPFVIVTNPDIFYLALYFQYGQYDQRNVFATFISQFQYVVIDEFHYYDNKQFANFLFFFALWQKWGYFEQGRSICLLSATPRQTVNTYLDRVFGADRWMRITPDNEPPESAGLQTTPTLTELRMTIVADQIEAWVQAHTATIEAWLRGGLDSAIISSSLGRINEINHTLRHLDRVRITGPEPHAKRQEVRPLMLATPTVDIGYNFGRPGKRRQSIDRLVCDARFGDELTQRIGRAGRVLGRAEPTMPSEAVVVVSEEALAELRALDRKRLSRAEWAAIIEQLTYLPPKHRLEGYIRNYAITESFYPIFHLNKIASSDVSVLEELFQMVREIFAPGTKQRPKWLALFFRTYEKRRIWLQKSEAQKWSTIGRDGDDLAQYFADYVSWRESSKSREVHYQGEQFQPVLSRLLLSQDQQKQELVAFIESQVALTKALFKFREAWQGPVAAVYDEQCLLSSETINRYDLFHLITNYHLHIFHNQGEFERECGATEPADLYIAIKGFRRPRLVLGFDYTNPEQYEQHEFEERYCRSIVAIKGLVLTVRERESSQILTLDKRLSEAIENDWIPCLIVAEESCGALIGTLRGSPFYARDLTVNVDGRTVPYKMVTGTAAFHVLPALKGHFVMVDKKLSDQAIFI